MAQTLRHRVSSGAKILFFDGSTIRAVNRNGAKLYYIDGNIIRARDKNGAKLLYFEGPLQNWAVVAALVQEEMIDNL